MNASPQTVAGIGDLPIKAANGAIVYVRDVASVRDGFTPQTNIVRQDGQRGALLSVYKTGVASTLDIVNTIRARLPQLLTTLPPELTIKPLFDQSIFVRASVKGVINEAVIAAVLTAAHDPALPGQLAAHGRHRHFHPAVDPGVHLHR